jgi:hypothetical protein
MLAAALEYAARGVPVFPIWGIRQGRCLCGIHDCPSAGKHPIATCAPQGFKNATTDAATIRKWWGQIPEANIATPTSWCTVLDVDVRHGGNDALAALERQHGALPDTPQVLTGGGGTHYYFKLADVPCSGGRVGAGLDVKATGGYVLLPPSAHVSGGTYGDDVMYPLFETALAPMPPWLFARAKADVKNGQPVPFTLPETIREGERNQRLYQLGRSLRAKGATEPEILESLSALNRSRCTPPLPDTEVRKTAHEAATQPDRPDFRAAPAAAPTPDEPPQTPTIEVVDAADLIARDFPEEAPLVGGGLIVPRSLLVTAGPPKRGKSLLVLNREIRRATGAPFLGFGTTPGRTLYFNAEIPEAQLKGRLVTMLTEAGPDGGALESEMLRDRLKMVTRRGLFLDEPAGCEEVRRLIEATAPDLVVFDPLARFMSGEENSARDMGHLIASLDRLTQQYGHATELVHHTGKPGQGDAKQGGHRLRGSSALFGAADSVVLLDRTAEAWMLSFELRHAEEPGPMTLTRSAALWYRPSGPPEKLLAVAEIVATVGLKWSPLVGAVQEDTKVSQRTAERLVRDTKKAGLIWQDDVGVYRRTVTNRHGNADGDGSNE